MKKYYVVLTGAKKNAGDYLITEKCKELLRYEKPDYDLVQLNRWESLEDHLEIVNKAEALILMGGPAVTENLYPGIYKLTDNLDDIKVPIVPMAVGWNNGLGDFDDMLNFSFSEESQKLLKVFEKNGVGISTRDSYTAGILNNIGIDNIFLTGCASWYTPKKFNKDSSLAEVNTIADTPAQDPKYSELSKQIMDLLVEEYPIQKLVCSFHRGIGEIDEHTSVEDAKNTQDLAEYAKSRGYEIIDLSYSYDNYQKYNDIDMHIGFRVHGHLYFLSNRKPSILLHEDGRGKAMSETLGLTGVDSFEAKKTQKAATLLNKVANKVGTSIRFHPEIRTQAYDELKQLISMHKMTNYNLISGVYKNFDMNYSIMKDFIHKLP